MEKSIPGKVFVAQIVLDLTSDGLGSLWLWVKVVHCNNISSIWNFTVRITFLLLHLFKVYYY